MKDKLNLKLIQELDLNLDPLKQIFSNRGIIDTDSFFEHSWDQLNAPDLLDNIDLAAERILKACSLGENISIIVDVDFDGYASAAILINYLKLVQGLGILEESSIKINYLLHIDAKTHGLADKQLLRQIRDEVKPNLLIIPDASGTEDQYRALLDLGIDIVVLDHHDVPEGGDNQKLIVVNSQQSKKYPNKSLCGTGVVYQLLRKFDEILATDCADFYIDLVAAAHVADVMSLASTETRFLVREGLKTENIRSPFLKAVLKKLDFSLKGKLTPIGIGFYVAPLINAVIRISDYQEKEIVFQSFLEENAEKSIKQLNKDILVLLPDEAIRLATNAKSRQKRRQDKLSEIIDKVIRERELYKDPVLILTIDDFNAEQRALSGLIANKLQDTYRRPIILLFAVEDKDIYTGSVRAPDMIAAFQNFKDQCESSGLCIFASGHQLAWGLGIKKENVSKLNDFFKEKYKTIDLTETYLVDFIFDSSESGDIIDTIVQISSLEDFYGPGFNEPLIAIKNVRVGPGTFQLLSQDRNPTLKFSLPNGLTAIKFKSSRAEFESLNFQSEEPTYYLVTLVGTANLNEYMGQITPQILIKDYAVEELVYDF